MDWSLRAVRQHLAARNILVRHEGTYSDGQPRLIAYNRADPDGLTVNAPDPETLYVRALRRLT